MLLSGILNTNSGLLLVQGRPEPLSSYFLPLAPPIYYG